MDPTQALLGFFSLFLDVKGGLYSFIMKNINKVSSKK